MSSQLISSVEILGVPVACTSRDGLFRAAFSWLEPGEKRTISYVNAHVLNTAVQDPQLKYILNQSDIVYADGISVVWASRTLYNIEIQKLTARAWIHHFSAQASENGIKLYLLGGREGISRRASAQLVSAHPGLKIVGHKAGLFSAEQEPSLVEQINQARPDILFVGLGTPLQEKWIYRHRQALDVPVCWSVGALFDYLAGAENPVPGWVDRLGFEWLWRLGMNPRGKWLRYLLGNPQFVCRVWDQKRKMSRVKA